MSLFGAMNTAISGLNAQSSAFGNISDNVANSQTIGFKRIDTSFVDFLTTSTATSNTPGAVVARPNYVNSVEGSITQTDNPTGMAIAGQGFFAVSVATGTTTTGPVFKPQQSYSRAGDFQMDKQGFLVNSAGEYLNGWLTNQTTGTVNQNTLAPIQMNKLVFNPVATSTVQLSANLPSTPTTGTATAAAPISSDVQVYDQVGNPHNIALNWTQTAAGDWTVAVGSPDDTAGTNRGSAQVTFGAVSGNAVPEGTIGAIGAATGSVTTAGYAANTPAALTFTTNFGLGAQTIRLNLGTYGDATGVTQYAGTQYNPRSLTQDGVQPGNYTGLTTLSNGDVVASYDNGKTSRIAQVPLVTFNNPGALQRQNGQAFTATVDSGTPSAKTAGTNGAGTLLVKSLENSNVDIASEFSQLIVAQQAYSANAKIVTTADTMLQVTLQMKQ